MSSIWITYITAFSLTEVEINTPMCSASSGTQKITGNSGKEHNVFVSHRQDGSVWMRFGEGNKMDVWKYVSPWKA